MSAQKQTWGNLSYDIPCSFLELFPSGVRDLLVGRTHFVWIDFATAVLTLDGVKG